MNSFYTNESMPPAKAFETFFGVLQAMQAIVNLGRFETGYDDPQQHMAHLMQLFLAPLADVYVSLREISAEDEPDQEGRTL